MDGALSLPEGGGERGAAVDGKERDGEVDAKMLEQVLTERCLWFCSLGTQNLSLVLCFQEGDPERSSPYISKVQPVMHHTQFFLAC